MKIKLFLAAGIMLIVALLGLVGCSGGGLAAADGQPINVNINSQQGIIVNGEGKITATPDITTLSLGITAQAPRVADAQAQATAAMDKVMAALIAAGIDKKDIQTQYYNITQIIDYSRSASGSSGVAIAPDAPVPPPTVKPPSTPTVTAYQVSNMVTVKVRAIEKTGAIIDAVSAAGGDLIRINSVYFSIDQPDKYYAQARTLAVNDAKDKATSLATLAGVSLGKATFVSEGSYSQPIPYREAMYKSADMAGGAPTTSISPGQTDVVLSVQIIYSIQ